MLSSEQIATIKMHYERGVTSASALARILPFKVSRQALARRIKASDWEVKEHEVAQPELTSAKEVAALVLGNTSSYRLAAMASGKGEQTIRDWMKLDNFRAEVEQRQAQPLSDAYETINQAAKTSPKDAQWLVTNHKVTRDDIGPSHARNPGSKIEIGFLIPRG